MASFPFLARHRLYGHGIKDKLEDPMSKNTRLCTCASCEWIFTLDQQHPTLGGCPKCGFGYYGARYVYGAKAYH